jgi:hypothetical protein
MQQVEYTPGIHRRTPAQNFSQKKSNNTDKVVTDCLKQFIFSRTQFIQLTETKRHTERTIGIERVHMVFVSIEPCSLCTKYAVLCGEKDMNLYIGR